MRTKCNCEHYNHSHSNDSQDDQFRKGKENNYLRMEKLRYAERSTQAVLQEQIFHHTTKSTKHEHSKRGKSKPDSHEFPTFSSSYFE